MRSASLLLVLVATGCFASRPDTLPSGQPGYRWAFGMGGAPAAEAPPPLYARDGSVVTDPVPGSVSTEEVLPHEMQPTAAGRMYLLELYQQAIDERDALELEVASLARAMEDERRAAETLRRELEGKTADLAGAEQEIHDLLDENQELAARLATAQIRRLEAERMLLEAKLEWLLAAETPGVTAVLAPLPEERPK